MLFAYDYDYLHSMVSIDAFIPLIAFDFWSDVIAILQ